MRKEANCRASSGRDGLATAGPFKDARGLRFVALLGKTRFESVVGKTAALLVEEIVAAFQRGEEFRKSG